MDFIVYHSADLDGKTSGVVLQNFFPNAELVPFNYNQEFLPKEKTLLKDMVMADVTLSTNLLFELANNLNSLILIDHHVSAFESILEYAEKNNIECDKSVFNGLIAEYYFPQFNFRFYYSSVLSACEICYTLYPFGTSVTKEKIRLLGQYDTWRNNGRELVSDYKWIEQVLPFQMGARINSKINDVINFMYEDNINETILSGKGILAYQKNLNNSNMKNNSFTMEMNGIRFLVCNGIIPSSISFEDFYLEEIHDAMMAFQYSGITKQWNFSLYTTKEDVDILSICKNFGGGGHQKACGFSLDEHEFAMRDNIMYLGSRIIIDVAQIPEVNVEEIHQQGIDFIPSENKLFEEKEIEYLNVLEEAPKKEVITKPIKPKVEKKVKMFNSKKAANGKPGPKPKN